MFKAIEIFLPPSTDTNYYDLTDLEDRDATATMSVVVDDLQAGPRLSLQPHRGPARPQSHPVPHSLTVLQAGLQSEAASQDELRVLLSGPLHSTTISYTDQTSDHNSSRYSKCRQH